MYMHADVSVYHDFYCFIIHLCISGKFKGHLSQNIKDADLDIVSRPRKLTDKCIAWNIGHTWLCLLISILATY